MKNNQKKPGVILLPVSAVLIIFIVLLFLVIDQKQSNNALSLEYNASRLVNLLLDLYVNGQDINPAELDENIIGLGIYDQNRNAVLRYGSAPVKIPSVGGRRDRMVNSKNRSIVIIRSEPSSIMHRLNEARENRGMPIPPLMTKYQTGIFLEYGNSSYASERRLIGLVVVLFILFFTIAVIFVYRLYQSNQQLLMKTEQDKQLVQLGEAARTLAHEIRNPLGSLKLQRDLLSRKLPEGYEGNLEIIDRELKRLNTLVERVGEFLRNPLGNPESIVLADFAKQLYLERSEVAICVPSGMDKVSILFDRDRLRSVFDNLVNNAVDSGGSAEIIIKKSGRHKVIEVQDKGSGFSDEAIKRLYDPFFTTKNNGTGLGLSVVKRLVESAGGEIKISNLQDGASVEIIFGDRYESTDR